MDFVTTNNVRLLETLRGMTGALGAGISATLVEAPCLKSLPCKKGLEGVEFGRAVKGLIRLLDAARTDFRERLFYVLYHLDHHYESFPELNGGCANLDDLSLELFESRFEAWREQQKYRQKPLSTIRLVNRVMKHRPGREFCDEVANSFPSDVLDAINYTFYRYLIAACKEARLDYREGQKKLRLRFSESDSVCFF